MLDKLDKLVDIHNLNRWIRHHDGRRWRITQKDNGSFLGEVTTPSGSHLVYMTHPSRSYLEWFIEKTLNGEGL